MIKERVWALVPAAGSSQRMKGNSPKQYALLNGVPVLSHVLKKLSDSHLFSGIVLVIAPNDTEGKTIAASFPLVSTTVGGATRLASVFEGLRALNAAPSDWVFVHDAARPCVRVSDILALYQAIQADPVGGILGYPARDTLKQVDSQLHIIGTVDRSAIWHALTPQAFRYELMYKAIDAYLSKDSGSTDSKGIEECAAMELSGYRPKMVLGRTDNIKITYPQDMGQAHYILQEEACE